MALISLQSSTCLSAETTVGSFPLSWLSQLYWHSNRLSWLSPAELEWYRDYSDRAGVSARSLRGEWEAGPARGRGIVEDSNGGFPPPVSQTHHVTRPEKQWDGDRGRLRGGLEAEGVMTLQTGRSKSLVSFLSLAADQIAAEEIAAKLSLQNKPLWFDTNSNRIIWHHKKHLSFFLLYTLWWDMIFLFLNRF